MTVKLNPGDEFTIEGVGYDSRGWLVCNGYTADGKPGVPVKPAVWVYGNDPSCAASLPCREPKTKTKRTQPAITYGPKKRGRWK
jgi:hypothetical protein